MLVSGLSGNATYCLGMLGFSPGDLVVGNSVCSLGLMGAVGSSLRTVAGGEIESITSLISEGRHAAMARLAAEAHRHGALGVTGMATELSSLSGYTEFLSQGTSLSEGPPGTEFFTTSASGTELYCHVDAGYRPISFVMGNIAYALGLGRGLSGGLRTLARGEVHEYSSMYNRLRHQALWRMRREAASVGANAVVDIRTDVRPFGVGVVELLMTGTASHHPSLPEAGQAPALVATSELTGAELHALALMGYAPVQLVMATSVTSLGLVGGIGASFAALSRGELTELTSLVYDARERCIDLIREEAKSVGAERVVGNRMQVRELAPGLIEVIAIGTAIRKRDGMAPRHSSLPLQAIIRDDDSLSLRGGGSAGFGESMAFGSALERRAQRQLSPLGCLVIAIVLLLGLVVPMLFLLLRPSR